MAACLAAAFVMFVAGVWGLVEHGRNASHRGRGSYVKSLERQYHQRFERERARTGSWPPALDGRDYYGPIDSVLPADPFPVNSAAPQPWVDPYRQSPLFAGEKLASTRYDSERNPDGWVRYRGYPMRYFRPADGGWGLVISNGPDGDEDLTRGVLDGIAAKLGGSGAPWRELPPFALGFTYDPTNGVTSNGDLWRLLADPIKRP